MRIEDAIEIEELTALQAGHRFFYLHETRDNLMAQMRLNNQQLEMALRKYKKIKKQK